jgi:hypothetical protein
MGGAIAQDPSPSQSGPRQVSYSRNLSSGRRVSSAKEGALRAGEYSLDETIETTRDDCAEGGTDPVDAKKKVGSQLMK